MATDTTTEILMPRLSDSMQQGTILSWLAADGDPIAAGQELVEIETDKATMSYEAEAAGVLSIAVAEGATVAVGELIARLLPVGSAPATPPPPADGHRLEEKSHIGAQILQSTEHGNGGVAATPMARRIAAAHGVDLATLAGSGPRGRVLRADVIAAAGIAADSVAGKLPQPATAPQPTTAARPTAAAQPTATPQAPSDGAGGNRGDTERVQLTRLQRTVARRMAEAKATVPEFQVQTEVEISAAVALHAQLKQAAAARDMTAPSLNDLIVKACALCLRRHPRANGAYVDGAFELHGSVNVGIAVAAGDALVVPVIHDADALTLGQLAARSRELAQAVRDGTVTPPQLSGATFTISNLGMYGMTQITPVINPPQAAILGVGAIRDVLARSDDGAVVDSKLLTLTLSCDHRILYGADAARFLAAIRDELRSPVGLAL